MATPANIRCPACHGAMVPAALKCGVCELTVTGGFISNEFASLGEEELHFLRIFVHCEGRIREMESALGVSYPTIKNRLMKLKEVLASGTAGAQPAVAGFVGDEKGEIVAALEGGRISFEEAMERLKLVQKRTEPVQKSTASVPKSTREVPTSKGEVQ